MDLWPSHHQPPLFSLSPEERHLGTVHAGTKPQRWVVLERRHDEAEHQCQAHKQGRQHDLKEQPSAAISTHPPGLPYPFLLPLYNHPWLPSTLNKGVYVRDMPGVRQENRYPGALPCSHLCKQTTTAAVGEQEALKEQGLELLAGQRPALYPAYDIWPSVLQGLCLWGRPNCRN